MNRYVDYCLKTNHFRFNQQDISTYTEAEMMISPEFENRVPQFAQLLGSALKLTVTLKDGNEYWLLCWEVNGSLYEMICLPSEKQGTSGSEDYQLFISILGGTLEYVYSDRDFIDESEFYWLNMSSTLCLMDDALDKEYISDIEEVLDSYDKNELPKRSDRSRFTICCCY